MKKYFFIIMMVVLFLSAFTACAGAQPEPEIGDVLEIYPGPGTELYRSPLYSVEIWDGKEWVNAYTYHVSRTSHTIWHWESNTSISFLTFGTTVDTQIRIRGLRNNINSVQISPKSRNFPVSITNGIASLQLSQLDKVWITINNDDANPLFIFADPPKPRIPQNAVYFGPGVHEIGHLYRPRGGQTVYLDGGAWLKGNIDIRGLNNIKIIGPGVLSGEIWQNLNLSAMEWETAQTYFMILGDYGSQNTGNHLEGITIANTPGYSTFGGMNLMRNIKLISPWRYETDGFYVMPDRVTRQGLIEECFAFIGDDIFFPRENRFGNITIRNCFVGSSNTGVFQLSYWPGSLNHNFYSRVENIDVKMYWDYSWDPNWDYPDDKSAASIFRSILDGDASSAGMGIKNYIFKDIRIEGPVTRLIQLENRYYPWGGDRNSPALGSSNNIQFINITTESSQLGRSRILGKDTENGHSGILFENVRIGGTLLTTSNFDNFFSTNQFVNDITVR